ncbi:sentrin-specific protease 6 isoform X2 [Bombina bombina]|uniref:sentrin-specific protease 6 isoform X2 n=1 Tax=Bombina bombina TaxID=8345 RepID=UPI00235A7B77|nr:sentrin-specific protease 6 isoform X2 [Bombina bombina]
MAGGGESRFLEALDRSQTKKNAGFGSNWTFDHSEESDGDVEKDEANLLSLEEEDGADTKVSERKPKQIRSGPIRCLEPLKTYERKTRALHLKSIRGNAIGLNMLGANKKLGENAKTVAMTPGTMVQGRLFHHTNIQRTSVKTAAQRKEYPPHVQKIEIGSSRIPLENMQETNEESDLESEPEIRRKVMEPDQRCQHCTTCIKENKSRTKCQSCGDAQRLFKQTDSLNKSAAPLSRISIHHTLAGEKTVNVGLNAKNFYSLTQVKPSLDIIVKSDSLGWKPFSSNGKSGLSSEAKSANIIKLRGARSSEPNDTIVLSSDDEEGDASMRNTNRIESISPRPADSACSSPAPCSGKVEAALKENTSSPDSDVTVALPRKARMKDQFGNAVASTPVKRRKVSSLEIHCDVTPVISPNTCESIIIECRNVRIGTFCRMLVEPVVFSVDFIKVHLEVNPDDDDGLGFRDINFKTLDLIRCDWCTARKLPIVFFQTQPAACQCLRSKLRMSRENGTGWYDCGSPNVEEQFIVFIFERALSVQENAIFEKILYDIGCKNSNPKFLTRIPFEEANGRIVAFTKNIEDIPTHGSGQKEIATKHDVSETSMNLRNTTPPLQFYGDDDEVGDTHTVFVGPIEKLIVYPPPPAKGGISVTNEDLHCLNEGEFLNDVIIDFYLKYLVLEKLRKDADRIHIFSSFFYKRLNQRERRNLQDTANLTLQQRRHGRVKTWTRHVDLFQKDFIFVPLNEAAHWFLAVICFPGLEKPEYHANPYYQVALTSQEDGCSSASQSDSETILQATPSKSPLKKTPNKKLTLSISDTSSGADESDTSVLRSRHSLGRQNFRKSDQGLREGDTSMKSAYSETDSNSTKVNGITNECKSHLKPTDALHRIQISYSDKPVDGKKTEEEFIDFSDDPDNLDESSDDGCLADDNCTSEVGKWHLKPTLCKQPCILLMDSLRGPSRSTVVKTLREYLEVEWEVRKGTKRSFSKDVMKGSNPRVPQQNNFSDCGVYILQYVESFFENPIQSFDLPMNLTDWFPQQRMKTKREEIRNLILTLQGLQIKEKKGHVDLSTTQTTPQEGTEQFISSGSD